MAIAPNNTRITVTVDKDLLAIAMLKGKTEFLNKESEVVSAALKLYIENFKQEA